MLQKDPNRQWFVYFKEKEFGPLAESIVHEKFQCGEFSEEAYVFSEGMDDWELLKEINVFNAGSVGSALESSPGEASAQQSITARTSLSESDQPGITESKIEPEMSMESEREITQFEEVDVSSSVPVENTLSDSVEEDTNVEQQALPSSSFDPAINVEKINEGIEDSQQPGIEQVKVSPRAVETRTSRTRGPSKILRFLLSMVLAMTLAYSAWVFLKNPIMNFVQEIFPSVGTVKGSEDVVPDDTAGVSPETVPAKPSLWEELAAVKNPAAGGEAPAFGISSHLLDSTRPVIVGALSSQYEVDEIKIAFYPNSEKSLLSFPQVWTGVVPVLEGYFTFGPISYSGGALPPGLYHVMAYAGTEFLGEIDLQVGEWPNDEKVLEYNNKKIQQSALRRASEQEEIAELFNQTTTLQQQLNIYKKIAFVGPKNYKQFLSKIEDWNAKFIPFIQKQYKRQFQPSFYPQSQALLYDYLVEILDFRDSLTMLSRGGRALLYKEKKLQPGTIDKEMLAVQQKLNGEILVMKDTEAVEPKVSIEDVKRYLEEL